MIRKSAVMIYLPLFIILFFACATTKPLKAGEKKAEAPVVEKKKKLVIKEYSDFQCYYCGRVQPTIKKILADYGDKVEIIFKQFPLTGIHPNALIAAKASIAAKNQGKFWELHDMMFQNQQRLAENYLIGYAKKIGLDMERFKADLGNAATEAMVMADMAEGRKLGIRGTPTFIIGETKVVGAVPYEKLKSAIEKELNKETGVQSESAGQD